MARSVTLRYVTGAFRYTIICAAVAIIIIIHKSVCELCGRERGWYIIRTHSIGGDFFYTDRQQTVTAKQTREHLASDASYTHTHTQYAVQNTDLYTIQRTQARD